MTDIQCNTRINGNIEYAEKETHALIFVA